MSSLRRRQLRGVVVAGLATLGFLWVFAGHAGGQPKGQKEEIARGKLSYRIYCRNCHGAEAKGDGSVASLLKVPPSDLTTIRARNGGTFPEDRVIAMLDGREEVAAHGSRDMPLWGQVFQEDPANPGVLKPEAAQAKIKDLVAFLKSIQTDAAPAKPGP
ncbi:MAG TPA: c-type cytochrome [Thermoanaerobaculia bacterium]|nr:c-type cytochrome [Thermoanaerobaculia bacterium]